MEKFQEQLRELSEQFNKLQQDLQEAILSRQKLDTQKQENTKVQNEFDNLKEGEIIYKLVGPVLLKQEKFEAEGTVKGRLDFISKEIERVENQISEIEGKIDSKRAEIIRVQTSAQAALGGQGKAAAATKG